MKVERLWFVLPLNLAADPNKTSWGPEVGGEEGGFAQPAPAARREDNRRVRFGDVDRVVAAAGQRQQAPQWPDMVAELNEAPPQQQVLKGRGFYLSSESKKSFQKGFTTEEMAVAEAEKQAELFPKTPFGVFACIKIFETTTPKIIEKTFNEAGELRVK